MNQMKADIVVIGGGAAGLPAALTAAESGAKNVVVLEKRFATGGDGLRANGIFAVETSVQKEAGVNVSKDEIFKKALDWHSFDQIEPRIIRAFINKSADTVRWLEEKGVALKLESSSVCWHVPTRYDGGMCNFGFVLRLLTQQCRDAGVQFLLRTSARKILRGPNGEITGVVALTTDGQELTINTGSIILSTGGFLGNKELLKKYFPTHYDEKVYLIDGLASNTGDGILMATEAGASLADSCTMLRHGTTPPTTATNHLFSASTAINVNKRGKRYIPESLRDRGTTSITMQPDKIAYALYDDKIVQDLVEKQTDMQRYQSNTSTGEILDTRQLLQKYAREGTWVKIADNLNDISHWIGCDPRSLEATINEYNSYCDHGYDNDFAKEPEYLVPLRVPPYYAVKLQPIVIETIGPLRINEHTQVLDEQDNPIPGFYAAGVVTGGWVSNDYYCPGLQGRALGFSMHSGRIAGENASKYILKA